MLAQTVVDKKCYVKEQWRHNPHKEEDFLTARTKDPSYAITHAIANASQGTSLVQA